MRFFLLVLCILSVCSFKCKRGGEETSPYYFVRYVNGEEEEQYYKYIGDLAIQKKEYKMFNLFKRIRAAELWHGQSILLFINSNDIVSYSLDANTDFPTAVVNKSLYFSRPDAYAKIDSFPLLLCLPTGCVEKSSSTEFIEHLKIDSVRGIFEGMTMRKF